MPDYRDGQRKLPMCTISCEVHDHPDALAQMLGASGDQAECRKHKPGFFRVQRSSVSCNQTLFCQISIEGGIEFRGLLPTCSTCFAFPESLGSGVSLNGIEVESGNLIVLKPCAELHLISQRGFQCVMLQTQQEISSKLWGLGRNDSLSRPDVFCQKPGPTANLYNLVCQSIHAANSDISGVVIRHLNEVIDSQPINIETLKTVKTRSVLNRSLTWIDSHINTTQSIKALCRDTGISERTLERYYKRTYNRTPKQYLIMVRLNQVYRYLKAADPYSSSVSTIASSAGFQHMGRFASQYVSLFGEAPKKTLGYRI